MIAVIVAMFGVTFFLFMLTSTLVYARLVYHRRLSGQEAPSLWVEIGPIGMSMGTMCGLPTVASHLFGAYANTLHVLAAVFAMAMWGIGLWWILMSSLHTLLHLTPRGDGLPFHLGWWSYVFPIGSFTSGTYALDHLLGHSFFAVAGVAQLAVLWVCFAVVFVRTIIGTVKGDLVAWRSVRQVKTGGDMGTRVKQA
ncbi:hypothetical protein GCM10025858_18640 [Alicyclobacillus sacchari]|nr:hypothetical protein GCM10025858_18640 [Alicyclobacillus sacchari]